MLHFCRRGLFASPLEKGGLRGICRQIYKNVKLFRQHQILLVILLSLGVTSTVLADPWHDLQQLLPPAEDHAEVGVPEPDPWAKLIALYLPYTEQDEQQNNAKLHHYFNQTLAPFQADINKAAILFNVPKEVIAAVIMVESSGNPQAKARTSSAKGLMQTIDSTFGMARKELLKKEIIIADNPYNPRASIYAGAWYLSTMFDQAVRDGRVHSTEKAKLKFWRIPVEYYYAGPGHGRKKQSVVLIYAGGKRVVVDKAAYSRKVMGWLQG